MSDLVSFPLGDRTVLVTKEDADDIKRDMHLFGVIFMTLAKEGGRYQRVPPADVSIRPKSSDRQG